MESDRRCARGGFTCSKSTNILWTQISVSLKISVGGRRAQRAHFPGNPTFKHLNAQGGRADGAVAARYIIVPQDRKSTRLNSSHTVISYAVFCLKKKKKKIHNDTKHTS